jgi:hypothetical protein
MPNFETITKLELSKLIRADRSDLLRHSSFVIRHSAFGISPKAACRQPLAR